MKRMTPEQYRREAVTWVENLMHHHLPRNGAWNLHKIMFEAEKLLRVERQNRKTGPKSADPSTPDRPFVQVGKPL